MGNSKVIENGGPNKWTPESKTQTTKLQGKYVRH
jgi:hypothetical protein